MHWTRHKTCNLLFRSSHPTFNQASFIRETIESVLAQDCPHIEHLIIDDGSTDETRSVLSPTARGSDGGRDRTAVRLRP